MRISDLFNELDEQERNELLDLPERETPAISVRDVRRRVNQTLDEDPAERRRHMKQVFKKGVCAALIAASLITGAFAASQMDFWHEWFANGTGDLDINTEKQSIDNGDLRLTLEQSLSDGDRTMIVYSLTALTDQGRKALDKQQNGTVSLTGTQHCTQVDFDEQNTAETHFYGYNAICQVPEAPLILHLEGTADTISVPTAQNTESMSIALHDAQVTLLNGDVYTLHTIELSPLSYRIDITVDMRSVSYYNTDLEHHLFFAMKDGSVRTTSQYGIERALWDHNQLTGGWNTVLDLSEIEGIIIGQTEYFVNGRPPAAASIPENLKMIQAPEIYQDDFSGTALRPLIEQLGGTVSYDDRTQSATVHYRGVTCIYTNGQSAVMRNGVNVDSTGRVQAKIIGGQFYVGIESLSRGLDIQRNMFMNEIEHDGIPYGIYAP